MMNNKVGKMSDIKMGLEYELQLMVEVDGKLTVIDASRYFGWQISKLPKTITFDLGNLEIITYPCESYFKAVDHANYILEEKLAPMLVGGFKLNKFALFLPVPICPIPTAMDENDNIFRNNHDEYPTCLKHWNISFENNRHDILRKIFYSSSPDYEEYRIEYENSKEILTNNLANDWKYDFKKLNRDGYPILIKDIDSYNNSRVHIKIPYHYVPPEGNPDLMPKFEDTLIPPERWRSLVGYYKNNKWTTVRKLI